MAVFDDITPDLDGPMAEVVRALKAVPGNAWGEEASPVATLLDARAGRETH